MNETLIGGHEAAIQRDRESRVDAITSHMFGNAVMGKNPARPIGVNPQHAIAGIAWVACERLADVG